ncbi:MAG: hypothetical protein WC453_02125 [Patescibacteria group bacterium]
MKKKEFEKYAEDYMESQHPTRAYDYQGKKMTWKRAAIYTLFDSFFIGFKWAVFLGVFFAWWTIFNEKIMINFAQNLCQYLR